jgi:predicted aspartyl protease
MAVNPRLVSNRFPYIPIRIQIRRFTLELGALLDTGFDGDVVVPPALISHIHPANGYFRWTLADNSVVRAPAYLGSAAIGNIGIFPVEITALGDEPMVGRGLSDRLTITLDHGQQLIIEP